MIVQVAVTYIFKGDQSNGNQSKNLHRPLKFPLVFPQSLRISFFYLLYYLAIGIQDIFLVQQSSHKEHVRNQRLDYCKYIRPLHIYQRDLRCTKYCHCKRYVHNHHQDVITKYVYFITFNMCTLRESWSQYQMYITGISTWTLRESRVF